MDPTIDDAAAIVAPSASNAVSDVATTVAPNASTVAPEKTRVTKKELAQIEALIDINAQRALESLDTWKLTAPFRGGKPGTCSKERHVCNMDSDNLNALCVGCALYKKIVLSHSIFPVGGQSSVCDYMATGIADPLIFAFIKDATWLAPMANLRGRWFVKHPITFALRKQSSMCVTPQCAVRRNRVRIFNAEELLARLHLTKESDAIFQNMHDYWRTNAGGAIYSLDELLDVLDAITDVALSMRKIGIRISELARDPQERGVMEHIVEGVQEIILECAR